MILLPVIVFCVGIIAIMYVVHQRGDALIRTIGEEFRHLLKLRPTQEALNGIAIIGILIIATIIILGEEAKGIFHLAKSDNNSELLTIAIVSACLLVTGIILILSVKYVSQR
jgi:hypothetical protein